MGKRILYYKKFDESEWLDDIDEKMAEDNFPQPSDMISADEFLKKVKEMEYVPVPERMNWKDCFVKEAIQLSEEEKTDIEIVEWEYGIEVNFHYDLIAYISGLTKLFVMADEVTVLSVPNTESRMDVTVVYYTHEQYFNGRKVRELRRLPFPGVLCHKK